MVGATQQFDAEKYKAHEKGAVGHGRGCLA